MAVNYFIAGTDTGVGKTLIACALLLAANKRNLKSLGLKPLAAGCDHLEGGWYNEDALALQECASLKLSYQQINPLAYKQAVAPHIAAAAEGKRISVDKLVGFSRGALQAGADFCVVEGAGGWRVPLNPREYLSALPKELNLPVILVVGMRLGCLNHALLSAEAIRRDGVNLTAWVANVCDENMPALEENIDTLTTLLACPLLGVVPKLAGPNIGDLAAQATAYLDIEPLISAL